MVTKLKSQAGLNADEIEEWEAWEEDIITAIQSGLCDRFLQRMTKVSVERAREAGLIKPAKKVTPAPPVNDEGEPLQPWERDLLQGDLDENGNALPLAKDGPPLVKPYEPESSTYNGPRRRRTAKKVTAREADKTFPLLHGRLQPLTAVQVDALDSTEVFTYAGKTYRKADIKGKAVRIPPGCGHKWEGKYVVVSGIANKAKIAPADPRDSNTMTLPINGEIGFIDKKFLAPYFG